MPRGDRTGPAGIGPMTGRGMGYCAGFNAPGFVNPGFQGAGYGRGLGIGRGFARGGGRMGYGAGMGMRGYRRYGAYPAVQPFPGNVDEKSVMTDQVKFLEEELEIARKQLAEIEKTEGK